MNILSVSTRKFYLPLVLCFLTFLKSNFNYAQDTLVFMNGEKKLVTLRYHNNQTVVYNEFPAGMFDFEIKFANKKTISSVGSDQKVQISHIASKENANISDSDNIILKSGNELNSKVISVSEDEVTYKLKSNLEGPSYKAPTKDILMIIYANGDKDIITLDNTKQTASETLEQKGFEITRIAEKDAENNYSSGAPFFAGLSTIILSPLFALIPAVLVSSEEPKEANLNYPDSELFQTNYQYNTAYKRKAHKMKKRAVWTGYSIGATINIIVTSILIYTYY